MSRPKIIAFDFCGTLAELYPETNDVLCKFIRKTYQTELSNDNAAQAIDHVSKITPYYSSVKILEESQKLEYYVDFNSKVLKKLGADGQDKPLTEETAKDLTIDVFATVNGMCFFLNKTKQQFKHK